MLSINHNLPAASVANNLSGHYLRLQTSTERLSSGLRINSAADDAAGLAIRELQRSDIAALEQGARNANDAISMLQTFDGALSVIDEKLIRMKELAEQAATGTYDSTQRLMIDSEFQAMGSEIDRIANATDFNGVKLLCTKMITWYEDVTKFRITDPGSIANLTLPAGKNGTPVLRGVNPNNYINANNPTRTISVNLTATTGIDISTGRLGAPIISNIPNGTRTEYKLGDTEFTVAYVDAIGSANNPKIEYNAGTGWAMSDDDHPGGLTVDPINPGDTSIAGFGRNPLSAIEFSMSDANSGIVDFSNFTANYPNITDIKIDTGSNTYSITRNIVEITDRTADYTASYNQDTQTVTVRLANGGTVSMRLDNPLAAGDTINFDINFEGEVNTQPEERHGVDPNQKIKIHFGPGNDSAEDYYYIKYTNCTRDGLGIGDVDIQTQDKAQEALVQINDAIVRKDKVRAEFGAMQNRLENTITNLKTQSENLQASESRISDADIATEMMVFVRNQILTQSAVAMLAQANSMPQMVMSLIG